jgi:oxygen-independent coproporphyrinogen-3 oxidase
VASFANTLDKIIAAAPDRFSIFNYAHMPARFKTQRQINDADMPSAQVKLDILQMVGQKLTSAGYVYIGMDHFAKPDDELAIAQREGKLYRNFQGYSTHSDCDLIGFGITSIGRVGDAYIQNVKELDEYDQLIKQNKLPVYKGVELDFDDKLRRAVITHTICHFELDFSMIEALFSINFAEYFAKELTELAEMQVDGLITITANGLQVLPVGRLLIRNVCMVFDKYLAQKNPHQFSKVI